MGNVNNAFLNRKYLTYKEWKLLAPDPCEVLLEQGKYLTYKEWKRKIWAIRKSNLWESLCKYLTYKEWKQETTRASLSSGSSKSSALTRKYLTYKEWKHTDLLVKASTNS